MTTRTKPADPTTRATTLPAVDAAASLSVAALRMEQAGLGAVLVVKDGIVLGSVTSADLLDPELRSRGSHADLPVGSLLGDRPPRVTWLDPTPAA